MNDDLIALDTMRYYLRIIVSDLRDNRVINAFERVNEVMAQVETLMAKVNKRNQGKQSGHS